ncbi:uncharacterized protein LOC136077153 isoform X2 [Hydra vulgaris]|uniref:Uncharacterized protein LOC136077153 isoform X2 n=1 Tax=Hydra vulgaris TaxID=6087 RepID=A0ABM4BG29_HYDVU
MASVSMTDSERNLFYDHMGHSEAINKHIHQAPPAIMPLAKTGLRLSSLDKGQQCASPAKFAKIDHMQPINNYENNDELLYESDNLKCDAENKKGPQFTTSDKNAKYELVQFNSNFGRLVLAKYDSTGALIKRRQDMIHIVVNSMVHRVGNMYPSTKTKSNLAKAIITAFPKLHSGGKLGYENYYSPYTEYVVGNKKWKVTP